MAADVQLWAAFKERGCQESRTRLIEQYRPLVPLTRQRVVPCVPYRIDPEDVESEGLIALVRAVDKFDPGRGVRFQSLAITMIRGAMLEYLRQEDWLPRSVRTKQKRLQEAERALAVAGIPDSATARAHYLDVSLDDYYRLEQAARSPEVLSLADVCVDDGEYEPLWVEGQIEDDQPGPEALVLAAAEREWSVRRRDGLPSRERELIHARCWEGKTFAQIAGEWGRSESRIHQIHAQAVEWMRMAEQEEGEMEKGSRRIWTAAEDAELRRRYGRESYSVIGAALERSAGAGAGRISLLGLANGARPTEETGEGEAMPEMSRVNGASVVTTGPPAAPLPSADPELMALSMLQQLLEPLDARARVRVLRWAADRFEILDPTGR